MSVSFFTLSSFQTGSRQPEKRRKSARHPTAIEQIRPYRNMRLVIALFLIGQAAGQSIIAEPARTVQVRSYVRKDRTVVAAYTRAGPAQVNGWPNRAMSGIRCGTRRALGLRRDRCCRKHENMQWQSVAEAKAKDEWERNACQRPASIPAVALPLETSIPPRDSWREERRDQRAENRGPRLTSSVTTTGLRSPRVRMARPHSAREIKNRGPRKAPQQTQTW